MSNSMLSGAVSRLTFEDACTERSRTRIVAVGHSISGEKLSHLERFQPGTTSPILDPRRTPQAPTVPKTLDSVARTRTPHA